MKPGQPPIIKIDSVSVKLLAFYPNLRGGKNQAYVIIPNDKLLSPNDKTIRPDETGQYLYVNETVLPLSRRISLHKQAREKNGKALIFDERAAAVKFMWT